MFRTRLLRFAKARREIDEQVVAYPPLGLGFAQHQGKRLPAQRNVGRRHRVEEGIGQGMDEFGP